MNTSRLFVMVFVGVFAEMSCYSASKVDSDDFETKLKLLSLLSPPSTSQGIEYPSAEFEKNNYINKNNNYYNPSYKSKYHSGHHFASFEDPNQKSPDVAKNEDFGFPWSKENKKTAEKKPATYEVVEANDETDFPFFSRPSQKFAGYHPGHGPKYGFYQGQDPHLHHSRDFHHSPEFHHQHTPDCHNRRRPRPPPPPPSAPTQTTTTTAASPSVDPRASTMAGIISTEVPRIDIRVGRHIRKEADRIVFED